MKLREKEEILCPEVIRQAVARAVEELDEPKCDGDLLKNLDVMAIKLEMGYQNCEINARLRDELIADVLKLWQQNAKHRGVERRVRR